ncbi:MAG: hypothetical protein V5A32_03450 [Halovenus sp.]
MKLRNWITTKFGLNPNDAERLIDPQYYTNKALQNDLVELDMRLDEERARVEELNEEYDYVIEQGSKAPEYDREAWEAEAQAVDADRQQAKGTVQSLGKQFALVRALKGIRRRMNNGSDLTVQQILSDVDATELKAEIRAEAGHHRVKESAIERALEALNLSAKASRNTQSGRKSKHRRRMEEREKEREDDVDTRSKERSNSVERSQQATAGD